LPRSASRLVVAAVVGLLTAAAPASAAWEQPQRIDQVSEGFAGSSVGDVAVGDNGLASILFLQGGDAGVKLYATRRSASADNWLATPFIVEPTPGGAVTTEAAPDGTVAGVYRQSVESAGTPLPGDESTVHNVIGLGWPASAAEGPKRADMGDEGSDEQPAVDADGRGNGWVAFIDGDKNVQIVRFDLTDPSKPREAFTVEATALDPSGNRNLNETESRSNPRIDANADGDVAVTFVETFNKGECCEPPSSSTAVYVVRKLQGAPSFSDPEQMSHSSESDPVEEHDVAVVDNGDITVLFAADPDREGTNRVFARRWLAASPEPRPDPDGIEFVSSSASNAPDVSEPRAEAGPDGRVTALWRQGTAQLNSSERSTNWSAPETLSTAMGSFDAAVDTAGVATAVYRESTVIRARRRAAGQQWAAAETISTSAASTDVPPRVDAGAPLQADAYFVQNDGARKGAHATRFTGAPPVEPPAPPLPTTGDCPADVSVLPGDAGMNTITGTEARETILGGDGDDTLDGAGGDDCVRGEGGNDTAGGGAGNDDVGGGEGDDRVSGGDGNDRMTGGAGADTLNGNAGDDAGSGGDGDDTIDGSVGNDFLLGDLGDDTVRGGVGDDKLAGVEGNDTIYGQGGTNILAGGIGNDRVIGGPQTDTVLGEDGDDTVSGGAGDDRVTGGAGNDRLRGGSGRNTLEGDLGDDGIRGGGQADTALGGEGIDVLFGFAGVDRLVGGTGDDKAYGGPSADRLFGNAGRDRLRGGGGADRVHGEGGNDKLYGDSGKDRVSGGAGGDVLKGGAARDRISGGAGNDRIGAVDNKRDTINCGAGRDRVVADAVDRVGKNCERVKRRR
jgi:Ca2+-binding RTX toxin-like protein